jgi:hypothetical protein
MTLNKYVSPSLHGAMDVNDRRPKLQPCAPRSPHSSAGPNNSGRRCRATLSTQGRAGAPHPQWRTYTTWPGDRHGCRATEELMGEL